MPTSQRVETWSATERNVSNPRDISCRDHRRRRGRSRLASHLGLQWLKKALLRIARPGARRKAPVQFQPVSRGKIDCYTPVRTAAAGAVAALLVVGGVAFLIRGWLSHIPREWLRFAATAFAG